MATKTAKAAAQTTETETPNTEPSPTPGNTAFLKQNFPHAADETVQPVHIAGSYFRVNVRKATGSGLTGLTFNNIVRSSFVRVETLNDGSPTFRDVTK